MVILFSPGSGAVQLIRWTWRLEGALLCREGLCIV